MAVENIIDAFYNACGEGNLQTAQKYFSSNNHQLNMQGMHLAIDREQVNIIEFLLPHMIDNLVSTFHRNVVQTDNVKLFHMFYEQYSKSSPSNSARWMELGLVAAAHANKRAIIDHCFDHVYSAQWWDDIRYAFGGGKVGAMQLGFEYLEEKIKIVQQREMLEQAVSDHGKTHVRKL